MGYMGLIQGDIGLRFRDYTKCIGCRNFHGLGM